MTDRTAPRGGLPADVRALLREESERVSIGDDARDRLATRLAASVVAFGAPPNPLAPAPRLPPAATAAAAKTAGLGASGLKVLLAVTLGASAVVGGQHLLTGPGRTSPPSTAAAVTAIETAPVAWPAPAPIAPSTEPVMDPVAAPLPAPPPRLAAPAGSPPAPAPRSTTSLREERQLLDEARTDLDRGDPAAALDAARAHAARFPRGVLAEARDALRIRALVRLGRSAEAKSELAAFRAQHPHSLLLGTDDDTPNIP